ncbi:hypothetical protein [Psychrobacter sp. ASPA161_6]|uniref:hypothetical protein n=1 Tax=Psychrobacter sp. ASPA161_6 TaxID=3160962 RepID=UPI003F80279C
MKLSEDFENEKQEYIGSDEFIYYLKVLLNESLMDIVSYLKRNDFEKVINSYTINQFNIIKQSENLKEQGFDKRTKDLLQRTHGFAMFEFNICAGFFTDPEDKDFDQDFFYKIAELEELDFIAKLNLDFRDIKQKDKVKKYMALKLAFTKEMYKRPMTGSHDNPHKFQQLLFRKKDFTIDEAASLLSGTPLEAVRDDHNKPDFTKYYRSFIEYKNFVIEAVKRDDLQTLYRDADSKKIKIIESEILQSFLYENGFIIKGFNEWLAIEPAKPLIDNRPSEQLETSSNELKEAQAKITELENQLARAKAELADKPADDKELPSNSQAGVARMLYAILTEHGYDLSPMKGKGVANDMIVSAANTHGTSVTRNFVADWLIRAREVNIKNY